MEYGSAKRRKWVESDGGIPVIAYHWRGLTSRSGSRLSDKRKGVRVTSGRIAAVTLKAGVCSNSRPSPIIPPPEQPTRIRAPTAFSSFGARDAIGAAAVVGSILDYAGSIH